MTEQEEMNQAFLRDLLLILNRVRQLEQSNKDLIQRIHKLETKGDDE